MEKVDEKIVEKLPVEHELVHVFQRLAFARRGKAIYIYFFRMNDKNSKIIRIDKRTYSAY